MLDPIGSPPPPRSRPMRPLDRTPDAERTALLPPPPPAMRPSPDVGAEAERAAALRDLAHLIGQLERWRRRQLGAARPAVEPPRATATRWVVVAGRDVTVRLRFEAGRPVELRTATTDRGGALAAAAEALDRPLRARGAWRRDAGTLDWCVPLERRAPARRPRGQ